MDQKYLGQMETFFLSRTRQIRGEAEFLGNLDKIDTKKHFQTSDIFVNEILLIWAEVNFGNNSLPHSITKRSTSRIIF